MVGVPHRIEAVVSVVAGLSGSARRQLDTDPGDQQTFASAHPL